MREYTADIRLKQALETIDRFKGRVYPVISQSEKAPYCVYRIAGLNELSSGLRATWSQNLGIRYEVAFITKNYNNFSKWMVEIATALSPISDLFGIEDSYNEEADAYVRQLTLSITAY